MATEIMTAKQLFVLRFVASKENGVHYRESFFVIGRSNGKLAAADALVRKEYLHLQYGFYHVTDAGRAVVNGVSS